MSDGTVILGYQDSFRTSVRVTAEGVLERLGIPGRLQQVAIVAIPAPGHNGSIVVNPETGPLRPEHFEGVRDLAGRLYDEHPLRHMQHSHPGLHAQRQDGIRRDCVGTAVEELTAASGVVGEALVATQAVERGDREVVICMALPEVVVGAVPELPPHEWGTRRASASLLDAAVRELRRAIVRDLALPEPGPTDVSLQSREIVARAADRFFQEALWRAGSHLELHRHTIDDVAVATYEQGAAEGHVLVANNPHPAVTVSTSFQHPVSADAVRQIRKMLETTGPQQALLVAGGSAHGIGHYDPELVDDPDNEVLEIVVTGHARWELRHHTRPVMVVRHGSARLPRPLFDPERLTDLAAQVLKDADTEALLAVVDAASSFGYGSTIVVSDKAENEADRLGAHGVPVMPQILTPDLFTSLAHIDGAFLVDPQGTLHAFGVILDGSADGAHGDPARGARYNSAVRYVTTHQADGVLVVVTSDDGGVDLIPDRPPRVPRQLVEDAVVRLELLVDDPNYRSQFVDARRRLEDLAFYLDEDQAERANDALRREQEGREREGAVVVEWPMFEVSPAPPDDYFDPS